MEEVKTIVKCTYRGEVDAEGRPHGKGELYYVVEKDPTENHLFDNQGDLRYKGEFVHGVRQGEGDLHALGGGYNPVSESEWYSEGDYDCGHLLHPAHAPGTWRRYVQVWYPYFEGTWQNDQPLRPRWGDGTVNERMTEEGWAYVRLTTSEAIKNLPIERKNNE